MSETVSTKFMIISDTHNFRFGHAERWNGKFNLPLPKVDVLLHCGDLTMRGGLKYYKRVLEMLGQIDAELKLVIAGNHDLSLDGKYWSGHMCIDDKSSDKAEHDDAIWMMKGPPAQEAGVIYLEEEVSTYTLKNGAKFSIYTSPYQPEFCGWAFPYERDEDRFNPPEKVAEGIKHIAVNPVPDFPAIDIMMTHGPPAHILDWTSHGDVGCEALLRAVSRARPRLYCFGHIHEAYGSNLITWKDDKSLIGKEAAEKEEKRDNNYPEKNEWNINFGKETLMINAAIMNLSYRPANSPWIVDLELPKTT